VLDMAREMIVNPVENLAAGAVVRLAVGRCCAARAVPGARSWRLCVLDVGGSAVATGARLWIWRARCAPLDGTDEP
ncbi:MAG: hypothetical protein ABF535_11320, partial [Acetobacter sp.]